jgi:hypothetical protein
MGTDWKPTVMIPVGVIAQGGVNLTTAPTSFTATPSATSVALSWGAPSDNGGFNPTSYTLKVGATTLYTGLNTSFNHTGLSNGTTYSYTVLATNPAGNSPTASASATTFAVPNAPSVSITSTSTYTTQEYGGVYEPDITVYWKSFVLTLTTPNDNGSAITSRIEQYSLNGTTWYPMSGEGNPDFTSPYSTGFGYTIQAGEEVYLRFGAINAVGRSSYSNVIFLSYNPYA